MAFRVEPVSSKSFVIELSTTENSALAPWQYWAQESPFSIALETEEERLSWLQLESRISQYACYLQQQGIVRGDVITLVGKNQTNTLFFYLAAQQIGAIAALTMPQPLDKLKDKLHTLYKSNQQAYLWFANDVLHSHSEPELNELN